jgi:hypothetical protein
MPHANKRLTARIAAALALLAVASLTPLVLLDHPTSSAPSIEARIHNAVNTLLAGIPQHANTLGQPAPITLEVYADLEDPDSQNWFTNYAPAIIDDYVRTGQLQIAYHSYKTDTYNPATFIKQQTAALAAGAQNKLWNYVETFHAEEHKEDSPYVTEAFLTHIAQQIPGLNIAQWKTDRHTGRREEQTAEEDQTARTTLHLHVTPTFLIGPTNGPKRTLSGHAIIKHAGQKYPVALVTTQDIDKAIHEIGHGPREAS